MSKILDELKVILRLEDKATPELKSKTDQLAKSAKEIQGPLQGILNLQNALLGGALATIAKFVLDSADAFTKLGRGLEQASYNFQQTEGNTKKYHELAQEIMDQTSKSLFYEYEVLGNPIGVAITHELRKKFDEYDLDLKRKTDEMGYSHDEESRRKVAQSFRTTPADVAILSAAIYEAKDNNLDVTVNSRDKDLQEAVEIIRERFGDNFGSKIYFVPEGLTRTGREYSNVRNQYREAM